VLVAGSVDPSEIRNSTISGNRAGTDGGGIHNSATGLEISNATIAFNQAVQFGGGMFIAGGASPTLASCLIADNASGNTGKDLIGSDFFRIDHCLISVDDGAAYQDFDGITIDPAVDPGTNLFNVDARLAPLASYGGKTQTHKLKKGSPAINAGSNPEAEPFDQRGKPFKRRLGTAVDIGAYERQ
jgi:hypothetical protein